jgi:hypothetical protein
MADTKNELPAEARHEGQQSSEEELEKQKQRSRDINDEKPDKKQEYETVKQ